MTKEFDDRELPDELPQVELGKGVSQAEAENFLQRSDTYFNTSNSSIVLKSN